MKKNFAITSVVTAVMIIFIMLTVTPVLFAQSDKDLEKAKYQQMFDDIYEFIERYYVEEVSPEQLYEGALKGMLESLDDPYSSYLSKDEQTALTDTTSGEYAGIGLHISKPDPGSYDPETYRGKYPQYVEIVAPLEGGPSSRAGLHAGDFITSIEGESVEEKTIEQVRDRLRGAEGTIVTFSILRGSREFDVSIKREIIEVPTVKYAMLEGPSSLMGREKIGFIKISQFAARTAERVKEAIEEFNKQKYTALIIDVRGNGGGLLASVVDIADFFLSDGTIVSTKSRIPFENHTYKAHKDNMIVDEDVPIVLLIDKYSASASEILAGALKDTGRAVLVGETTFGKGSVQQLRSSDEVMIKLTIARYYTPSDKNIDKIGIDPDVAADNLDLSEDGQDTIDRLVDSMLIENFVEKNKNPTESEIDTLLKRIKYEGYNLEDRIIRRMITLEIQRCLDFPPIYDLDYDMVLQTAINEIRK